ncbi:hypothetical protein M3181_24100 [Mesobacillus maritimus]|uniref:hypothetical protein n=1 Tax=Mesobacillus maritimus TaxID=1643336 RepID=UPI00203DC463|nr:hypothetical protein [Mesobacillus maritimus]MCM3671997.1 hypothetical protein [Mesobacillus maritimus]
MSNKEKVNSLVQTLSEQVQAQEDILRMMQKQLQQQQESFNQLLHRSTAQESLLRKLLQQSGNFNPAVVDSLPANMPAAQARDPFSDILSRLELQKLLKIAMYVSDLYTADNESK